MDREAYEEMALGAVEVAVFSLIANKLDKYVKQSARNTIALNASNDPRCRGYRRVASPTACEFCRQQADEGIVTSGDGGSFHAGCGCQNEPVFGDGSIRSLDKTEMVFSEVERIKREYPGAYRQWRETVKVVSHAKTSQQLRKHIPATVQFEREGNPSYFYVDESLPIEDRVSQIRDLIDDRAGKGMPIIDADGNWSHKEEVSCGRIIGVDGWSRTETSSMNIYYGKNKVHASPRYDGSGANIDND